MTKRLGILGAALAMALAVGMGQTGSPQAAYPDKPITVVVPFGAGGGSDTLMRTLQKSIEKQKLLPVPLVILNVGGAGSTIGSRRVKDAAPDGHTYLLSHFALLGTAATGVADFTPADFEPVAQLTELCLLYTVQDDAKWQTLKEFLDEAKAQPRSLKEAINIGAVVHITSWIVTDAHGGVEMRYVQTGGGAKRFPALVGGHVDAAQFSTSEYVSYSPKGIRALAYLGPERHPKLPDISTAKEQGIDATACINDWFFAPKGTPQDRIDVFANALIKALDDPDIAAFYEKRMMGKSILTGDALRQKISGDYENIKAIAARHMDELRALQAEQKSK